MNWPAWTKKRNCWIAVCFEMAVTGETIRKACLKLFIDGFVIVVCILRRLFCFLTDRLTNPHEEIAVKPPERNTVGGWLCVEATETKSCLLKSF